MLAGTSVSLLSFGCCASLCSGCLLACLERDPNKVRVRRTLTVGFLPLCLLIMLRSCLFRKLYACNHVRVMWLPARCLCLYSFLWSPRTLTSSDCCVSTHAFLFITDIYRTTHMAGTRSHTHCVHFFFFRTGTKEPAWRMWVENDTNVGIEYPPFHFRIPRHERNVTFDSVRLHAYCISSCSSSHSSSDAYGLSLLSLLHLIMPSIFYSPIITYTYTIGWVLMEFYSFDPTTVRRWWASWTLR